MSYSQYERGKYIRLKIHYCILLDLGKGVINAEQAGDAYDLMSEITIAGTTHNRELAQNKYYKKAIEAWTAAKKAHRKRLVASKTF